MFKSYLLIALRQLNKQRFYSAIKLGGFALSIAACLLITLYIRDELSYDRTFPHGDRLFRVLNVSREAGKEELQTSLPGPFSRALMTDFPQVEKAGSLMDNTSFYGAGSNELKRDNQVQNTHEDGFTYADQEVMDILGLPLLEGDRAHLLDAPGTMVITRRKAAKYFPHENPIGKTFYLNNDQSHPYKVTGVVADFASRSHLQFDFFLAMKGVVFFPGESDWWVANNHDEYVLLKPGVDPHAFAARMSHQIMTKYIIPAYTSFGIKDADTEEKKMSLELQPIGDVYLKSYNISDGLPRHGDIRFIWMFGGIAGFILLIACINFINLSTARSANRAMEVGLRKVVGSYRSSLVMQFLTESMVYSLLSFVLALVLVRLLLPLFNHLTDKTLFIPWATWWLLPLLLGAAAVVGMVSGLYPAFYLSNFKPIKVLKGQVTRGARNATLRSTLVVFQFTTTIILILGTFVIYRQMQYIMHKKLGFDKDRVLLIQGTGTLADNDLRTFKTELCRLPQVKSASIGDYLPIAGTRRDGNSFSKIGKAGPESPIFAQSWITDYDYIPTMGMHLILGRNFSRDMPSDTAAVIVNQAFVKKMGLTGNPVGQVINHFSTPMRVIGVLEDFHFETFREEVGPLSLSLGNAPGVVSIKTNTAGMGDLIPKVSALWHKIVPNQTLRYTFMDQSFKNMYADVTRDGSIFTGFAVLAIIIACLGLFALSSFMAEQRAKEIGIRKVLGASVTSLVTLMSRNFVLLVLLSLLIASPIAWYGMNRWLRDFVYRQEINWWLFPLVGVLAVGIALVTIGFQSAKAALDNPIKSLRSQ